ncbi:MAG: zinc ribbon domain-containing protein [Chloroflexi bacterium]|nr:zinc ribbon domain-containing protein [Chloroflexota bacterium]
MEKREGRKFVELEWVCPNCETRNKGSRKTCGSCGATQPENVQFQRAADEKIIADEKALEAAKAGADIHCGFCGTRNPATATTCSQCGGDLKEGRARQAGRVLQAAPPPPKTLVCGNCGTENEGAARTCKQCGAALKQEAPNLQAFQAPPAPSAPKKVNWLLWGGIGAFFILCCIAFAAVFLIPSKSVKGTVTDLEWQTETAVQEIRAVNYSDKSGNPPADAYNVSCRTESREICEEKTVDQGNGFAEIVQECRTESERFCDYTVDEWTTVQTYEMSGSDNFPVYQEPSVSSDQRVEKTVKLMSVTFSTSEGEKLYAPSSVGEFQQFEAGSVWTLTMNAVGGVMSVEK